jgi:hypothetical protein
MASVKHKTRSTPAERRRQQAREELKETSELAAILCSDAPDPVPTQLIEDSDSYVAPPTEHLEELKEIMQLVQTKTDSQCTFIQAPFHTYWIPQNLLKEQNATECSEDSDVHAKYPLLIHWAAKWGNIPVFECLVELDSQCLLIGNASGQSALHVAIDEAQVDWIRRCCSQFPSTCCQFDELRNLPLHHAACTSPNTNSWVATPLLAQYPKGILVPNQAGLYPVHLACLRAWTQGMKLFLAVAARLVDQRCHKHSWLPIDWALLAHENLKKEIQNKRGRKTPPSNERNSTLIPDFSKLSRQTLLSLQLDYDECLEILLLTSYTGRAVLSRDPERDFYPLHAIMRQPLTNWKYAVQCFGKPRHLQSLDCLGRSPLHVLLEEGNEYHVEDQVALIQELSRLSPQVLSQVDGKGCIPLQIAILENAPIEVVQSLVECGGPGTAGITWKPQTDLSSGD